MSVLLKAIAPPVLIFFDYTQNRALNAILYDSRHVSMKNIDNGLGAVRVRYRRSLFMH
jgi:hypothetical protein